MSRKNSSVMSELSIQDPDLESMTQQELLAVVKRYFNPQNVRLLKNVWEVLSLINLTRSKEYS